MEVDDVEIGEMVASEKGVKAYSREVGFWCNKAVHLTAFYGLAFIALGLGSSAPGPTLLILGENTDSNEGELGWGLFFMRAVGYFIGTSIGGPLLERFSAHSNKLIAVGIVLNGVCNVFMPMAMNIWLLGVIDLFWGIGGGFLDSIVNTIILYMFMHPDPYMHFLHFCWGFGAFVAPMIIGAWMEGGHEDDIGTPYYVIAAFYIPIFIGVLCYRSPQASDKVRSIDELEDTDALELAELGVDDKEIEALVGGDDDDIVVEDEEGESKMEEINLTDTRASSDDESASAFQKTRRGKRVKAFADTTTSEEEDEGYVASTITPKTTPIVESTIEPEQKKSAWNFSTGEKWVLFHSGFFLFLYVGSEVSCGGLLYVYAVKLDLAGEAAATLLTSAFYGSLTFGRLLAIPISVWVSPSAMLISNVVGCLFSLVFIIVFMDSVIMLIIGTLLFGVCNASSYATVLNLADTFMAVSGTSTSVIIAFASMEMFLPMLISNAFVIFGSYRILFPILLFVNILISLDLVMLIWRGKQLLAGRSKMLPASPSSSKLLLGRAPSNKRSQTEGTETVTGELAFIGDTETTIPPSPDMDTESP